MHIISKTTNDVGVLKQTGKHQQYISNGFTLSLQKELNTFLNELFNATLADHATRECVRLIIYQNRSAVRLSGPTERSCSVDATDDLRHTPAERIKF